MNIVQRIFNLIKGGVKTKTVDEVVAEADVLGQKRKFTKIVPYGIMYKLPDSSDILAVLLQKEGNEEDLMGFCTDIINRDTDLNDGEVSFGVPTLKARMKFVDSDKIIFKIGDTEGGDFAVRFNELETAFNELKDDFNTFVNNVHNSSVVPHTHPGVTAGGSSTGAATIVTGTQSTADITPAKVEEIEMPEL